MTAEVHEENSGFCAASRETMALLAEAAGRLRAILQDETIVDATPIEATTVMELALETIDAAVEKLKVATPTSSGSST
jgi:hypothetical protein